jgi:hypothetical protein
MSTKESLAALKKTHEALKKIKETLEPFLDLLNDHRHQKRGTNESSSSIENTSKKIELFQITEAEAAVALSIGTLRYMALRLKGQKSLTSDGKNDPLRIELDKMRKTLVELKKLKKKVVGPTDKDPASSVIGKKRTSEDHNKEDNPQSISPKRKK